MVVGQDGLSDGTPVFVLKGPGAEAGSEPTPSGVAKGRTSQGGLRDAEFRDPGQLDPSQMTPEQLEQMKERMRQRGMSDEQIEKALSRRLGKTTTLAPPSLPHMRIVDFSIRRPVTVIVFSAAALVFGLVAFDDLAVDLLPEIHLPVPHGADRVTRGLRPLRSKR